MVSPLTSLHSSNSKGNQIVRIHQRLRKPQVTERIHGLSLSKWKGYRRAIYLVHSNIIIIKEWILTIIQEEHNHINHNHQLILIPVQTQLTPTNNPSHKGSAQYHNPHRSS
jgi:hypothetical protein